MEVEAMAIGTKMLGVELPEWGVEPFGILWYLV